MKNIILSAFVTLLLSCTFDTQAQVPSSARLGSAVLVKNSTVELSILSAHPFYVGGNFFVLHIGHQKFDLSRQIDADEKSELIFLIPKSEYLKIKNGENIFLTYGEFFDAALDTEEAKDACMQSPNHGKYLGTFSSALSIK